MALGSSARVADEHENALPPGETQDGGGLGTWIARTVSQLSSIYGLGLMGSAANVVYLISFASAPLTAWKVGGATGSTLVNSTRNGTLAVVEAPEPDLWALSFSFYIAAMPFIVALRTTFAVAAEDPHPMPGTRIFGWKYAKICFASMIFFTISNACLT